MRGILLLVLFGVVTVANGCRDQLPAPASTPTATKGLSLQQISQLPAIEGTAANADRHPVVVRPLETPRVVTDRLDIHGQFVSVSCSSCHSNLPSNSARHSADGLTEFHQGLKYSHGPADGFLSCLTCHNASNYNLLRRADGADLSYRDGQQLCAQCHSKQNRDYEHGSHGGMNGYWDRTRGPQARKNCIDCHDPHSPQFPQMTSGFKPLDQRSNEPDTH